MHGAMGGFGILSGPTGATASASLPPKATALKTETIQMASPSVLPLVAGAAAVGALLLFWWQSKKK